MLNKFKNNIQSFIKDNIQFIIFLIVFIVVCFVYNLNNDFINYALKRGSILEYSINSNQITDKEKIQNKLTDLKIKYSYINNIKTSELNEKTIDFELNEIENILVIAIPYKAQKSKEALINEISKFIFDNYEDSKLIDIKPMNDVYSKPYNGICKFLFVFIISITIWLIIIAIIFDTKEILSSIKTDTLYFFEKQKQNFKNLIAKTKEKGIGYFLKRILLDDGDNEETSATKEILSTIIFVLVCVIIIRYFIGELRWIPSGSMRLTILEKDRVFVEKLDFPKKEIQRGDILVFYPPEIELKNTPFAIFSRLTGIFCQDIAFIKRVIGMPGDKFEVKYDNYSGQYRVFINDEPLNEPYVNSKIDWTPCTNGMYCGPFIIPKDNYFMMGDNRGNSQDSRFWGFLSKDRIIGRANFMFWPLNRINLLKDTYLDLNEKKEFNQLKTKRYILNRYEFLYKI